MIASVKSYFNIIDDHFKKELEGTGCKISCGFGSFPLIDMEICLRNEKSHGATFCKIACFHHKGGEELVVKSCFHDGCEFVFDEPKLKSVLREITNSTDFRIAVAECALSYRHMIVSKKTLTTKQVQEKLEAAQTTIQEATKGYLMEPERFLDPDENFGRKCFTSSENGGRVKHHKEDAMQSSEFIPQPAKKEEARIFRITTLQRTEMAVE